MSGNDTSGYKVLNDPGSSNISQLIQTTIPSGTTGAGSSEDLSVPSSHLLVYVLVPVGSLILVIILAAVVALIFRKNRLDKLRHHLMPLYSFDPADENGDWESELLENQEKDQQMALRIESPDGSPRLKFSSNRRQTEDV